MLRDDLIDNYSPFTYYCTIRLGKEQLRVSGLLIEEEEDPRFFHPSLLGMDLDSISLSSLALAISQVLPPVVSPFLSPLPRSI